MSKNKKKMNRPSTAQRWDDVGQTQRKLANDKAPASKAKFMLDSQKDTEVDAGAGKKPKLQTSAYKIN